MSETAPHPCTVWMNGTAHRVPPATDAPPTVATLLASLEPPVPPRGIAVAVNGALVPRRSWDSHPLAEGDAVEIVRALQGG